MEGQQRANAAQLAARNIKQAKGRQRKTPLKPSGNVQQSMQFGGSGGMFGGLAPPTSSFEFSAPGGPSFPPPSFGNGNTSGNSFSSPDISENEADPRADTTGEELLRRNRGFQMGNDQPVLFHTPDAFGGTQSTNANPFGKASTQEQPANNAFSFKPSMPQQPAPSAFNLNSTSSAKADSSNPFTFQPNIPKQPAPSAIGFNSTPIQDKPASNPFSFLSSQPAPSTAQPLHDKPGNNIFGGLAQPPTQPVPEKAANNIFGGLAQPAAPSSVLNFGSPAPQDKSTSGSAPFVFGQSSAKPSLSSIGSGPVQAAEKPANNLFGTPQQATSTEGAFSFSQQSTTQPNIFANANFLASKASSLFGNQSLAPNQSKIFGGQDQQKNVAVTSTSSKELPPKFSTTEEPKSQPTPTNNLFTNAGKAAPATVGQIGSPSKETAPVTNIFAGFNGQPTSTPDLFGNLNKPVTNGTNSVNASTLGAAGATTPSLFAEAPSTNVNGSSPSLFSAPVSPMPAFAPSSTAPLFGAPSLSPVTAATAVNGDKAFFSSNKPADTSRCASQPDSNALSEPTQGPRGMATPLDQQPPSTVFALSTTLGSNSTEIVDKSHLYREMAAATRITDEFMRPLVPARFNEEQRKEFYVTYRMRCLNKAMQGFFTTLAMGTEISDAIAYYQEQRVVIMSGRPNPTTYEKTGAVADREQDIENPKILNSQVTKPQGAEGPVNISGNSSNSVLMSTTPPKPTYQAFPGPDSPHIATSAPPSTGKRKAEIQLTKANDQDGQERRRMNPAQLSTPTPSGSSTSNIFKSIIDNPAKPSPEKKPRPLPSTSKDDTPRFNPFANLPLPASSESPKPAAPTISSNNIFSPKPASETNLFALKATPVTSPANVTDSKTPAPIKPPTFTTGPVNFMAQFGQQASKSEEKLMEEAKAEDMDSDDDEAEWEAKWREKRKAELKAIEELGKSKRATFTAGKFTFGQADKPDSPKVSTPTADSASLEKLGGTPQPPSKSLFGLNSGVQSSGDSLSSSATGSRTPTPGIAGSNTGSVLDGHVPGKPVPFVQNIFGHLSDADSGADGRKDCNQESDSGDEETENEDDSENKDPRDPSFQPGSEQSSSRTSPEEAGQGIVPAKKPLFDSVALKTAGYSSAAPNSGTSTPGGSLFDRITRDSSGNPVRQVSSDEKENTQPGSTANVANTTNPFSRSFDGAPADQTWKPNSPIKFGAPTVNVTEATPTKPASPFANLFGNSGGSGQPSSAGGSPKPSSNLFASLNASKPLSSGAVGFNFGSGLSTTTSSLLPSAAASATTSRATSPGGTTDGDSAVEGDPDAEHHEQINLTSGGPGEENEEVLHEVRAKALQWSSKEWQTRGVGPLRVLKHKDTGATRILLRADPSGTIVLNKSLLAGVKYDINEKTIKFPAAGEAGKPLETWLLQLKTPQFAQDLGNLLDNNKPLS